MSAATLGPAEPNYLAPFSRSPLPSPLSLVPSPPASGGTIRVRTAPLVHDADGRDSSSDGGGATETVVDMQLIVDYTGALARRAAVAIRDGQVEQMDQLHDHPHNVSCLRCAVLGAARHRTLAVTLLEVMERKNAGEGWNCSDEISDTNLISRLRRLAISSATMEEIYGSWWGEVMLACLRAEAADFELVSYLATRYQPRWVLDVHTRYSLAAYHLAMTTCPRISRDGNTVPGIVRNAAAVRLAVALASVAEGNPPAWLEHLPAPAL